VLAIGDLDREPAAETKAGGVGGGEWASPLGFWPLPFEVGPIAQ
jgi:hypothetical protein